LPDPDAKVKQVRRDGRDLRIEQDGDKLTLALVARTQQLEILWDEEHNLNALSTTPALNLNAPAANIDFNLTLPHTRWLLFTGGLLLGRRCCSGCAGGGNASVAGTSGVRCHAARGKIRNRKDNLNGTTR
jgi:hypothetical protein